MHSYLQQSRCPTSIFFFFHPQLADIIVGLIGSGNYCLLVFSGGDAQCVIASKIQLDTPQACTLTIQKAWSRYCRENERERALRAD